MEGGSMDVGGGYRRSRRERTNVPWYVESSASDEKSSGDEFSEGDEEENQKDLSGKDLFEKYQHSAAVVTKSMKKLISQCKIGKKIGQLCALGDRYMERECQIFHKKSKNKLTAAGILFPTCISVNSRFCFVSPHSTDDTTLAPNDIIKIEMSFDTDGCIASVVHTHMVAEKLSGRTAEVFYAAGISRDCVLRDMKHGTTKKELFESSISPALDGYGCKLLSLIAMHLKGQVTKA